MATLLEQLLAEMDDGSGPYLAVKNLDDLATVFLGPEAVPPGEERTVPLRYRDSRATRQLQRTGWIETRETDEPIDPPLPVHPPDELVRGLAPHHMAAIRQVLAGNAAGASIAGMYDSVTETTGSKVSQQDAKFIKHTFLPMLRAVLAVDGQTSQLSDLARHHITERVNTLTKIAETLWLWE